MKNKMKGAAILAALIVGFYIIFKILQPARFGSMRSMMILVQQSLLPAVGACGMYFIIIMGMFDFSLGANIVLSAIVGCLCSRIMGLPGLILGCVICGTLVGILNGLLYNKLKIPSIIATVGLCIVYECIGIYICGGTVLSLDKNYRILGKAPYNVIFCLVACVLAYIILKYTKIGTYCRAIGSNELMAKNMGADISFYKLIGFAICGFFGGVLAIVTISYGSSVTPATGMSSMGRNFSPIMGCFIGMALKKYINPVISMIAGEFLISMITNGLLTNNIDSTLQDVIVGVTLLIIVCLTFAGKKDDVVK